MEIKKLPIFWGWCSEWLYWTLLLSCAIFYMRDTQPDIVLLDLMMPDLDGWEVYQRLKSNPKTTDVPVIVVTARAQSIDKILGLHIAKVDDYITKPFAPADLLSSIKKVLDNNADNT